MTKKTRISNTIEELHDTVIDMKLAEETNEPEELLRLAKKARTLCDSLEELVQDS